MTPQGAIAELQTLCAEVVASGETRTFLLQGVQAILAQVNPVDEDNQVNTGIELAGTARTPGPDRRDLPASTSASRPQAEGLPSAPSVSRDFDAAFQRFREWDEEYERAWQARDWDEVQRMQDERRTGGNTHPLSRWLLERTD